MEGSAVKTSFAAVPFLAALVIFLFLYLKGKKQYESYVSGINKEDYALKDLFYAGFAFMELIRYQYCSNLDRKVRMQMTELYTAEFAEFYLRVTWAYAVVSAFIGLLLFSMFYAVTANAAFLAMAIVAAPLLGWSAFRSVNKRIDERHNRVSIELPELTNQIVILTGAGLTLKGALIKIAREMPADGPLYRSLGKAVDQMELGATDEQALDLLVESCNMPVVRHLVSVILQNISRGGAEVSTALYNIGKELWDTRKAAAQRIAEETTTKLLFPMMLMFLSVIILVTAPAIMGMR